jgi:hypothetical protein
MLASIGLNRLTPMTRVRLADGIDLQVDLPLTEVRDALQRALAETRLLEVRVAGGKLVLVNPQQVLYLEDAGAAVPPAAALKANGSRSRRQARRLAPAD